MVSRFCEGPAEDVSFCTAGAQMSPVLAGQAVTFCSTNKRVLLFVVQS